ncbi:MAG: hypothetical protein HN975_16690 [Anaerolineae bacterium]|jgi:hypothetical protein|nr:hypothetical protein [Anaerolineae bacterium]
MANLDNRVKQLESQGDDGLKDIHVYMWGDDPDMVEDTRTGEQMTRAEFERRTAGERVIRINRETVKNG